MKKNSKGDLTSVDNLILRRTYLAQQVTSRLTSASLDLSVFEPLPFTDYSLFTEQYDLHQLKINVNLHSANKFVFLPGVPIRVSIKATRKNKHHLIHPFVYTLNLTHGEYEWSVDRDYTDIRNVHRILAKIVQKDLGRPCSDLSREEIKPDWPLFPCERDHLVTDSQLESRCLKLSTYLERLLRYPPYRDHQSVLHLLSVSPISFTPGLSVSLIEGLLSKHAHSNIFFGHLKQLKRCLSENCTVLNFKRWFCLKDTYLTYTNPFDADSHSLGFTMLVDRRFSCRMAKKPGALNSLEVRNHEQTLILKFKGARAQKLWFSRIQLMLNSSAARSFHEPSANESFAPVRANQTVKWYINASLYMEHVLSALTNAKEEIFIAGWWLCPELYLKRPAIPENLEKRLDKVLLRKSRQGVRIYILLYKERDLLTNLSSERVRSVLTQNGRNQNIHVVLHPQNSICWSHHEKCVIIDQTVAFLGGIDLCYGRWDNELYNLVDLGTTQNVSEIDVSKHGLDSNYFHMKQQLYFTNHDLSLDKTLKCIINSSAITCNLVASNFTGYIEC